jgi:hypothetical protein
MTPTMTPDQLHIYQADPPEMFNPLPPDQHYIWAVGGVRARHLYGRRYTRQGAIVTAAELSGESGQFPGSFLGGSK